MTNGKKREIKNLNNNETKTEGERITIKMLRQR